MNRFTDDSRYRQAVTILKRARAILSAGFWGKGSYTLYKHWPFKNRQAYGYCALGAVHHASNLMKLGPDPGVHTAINMLENEAWAAGSSTVPNFNDHPKTTLADVLNLYDEAIMYAERKAEEYA